MERTWFSKEYYNSPMPHSIFFHGGFAIHGSYEISRLGGPASHGCIRLHPDNAATLYALVQQQGMEATTIVVSGSNPVAGRHAPAIERDESIGPAPVPPGYGRYAPNDWRSPGSYFQPPPGYYGYPSYRPY